MPGASSVACLLPLPHDVGQLRLLDLIDRLALELGRPLHRDAVLVLVRVRALQIGIAPGRARRRPLARLGLRPPSGARIPAPEKPAPRAPRIRTRTAAIVVVSRSAEARRSKSMETLLSAIRVRRRVALLQFTAFRSVDVSIGHELASFGLGHAQPRRASPAPRHPKPTRRKQLLASTRLINRGFHMATKIVDTILPTTMVGSYPRPHWFKHQLLGRDVRVAFKEVQHEEAYDDAVATVIRDQEEAGLDIVTDGNMWYDDYVGVIGSFCWYMYERIGGLRAVPGAASLVRRRRSEPGQGNPRRLGRRDQQRPGEPRADPARRSLQGRQEAREGAGQGVGRRRPGEPRLARVLQALQERRRS